MIWGMSAVKRPTGPAPSRKERAAETRNRILESALASFTEHGYSSTTMDKVAAHAGVAVQTVYFTFRTKGDLLQAVYEHVVLGPDDLPPHLSSWWRATEAEPDAGRAVRHLVEGTAELLERAAPLVWIVLGDETAHAGYEFNEALRRSGTEQLVGILAAKRPLRTGLSEREARDVLLVLTGPQLFQQLVGELKWTREAYVEWAAGAVQRELFGPG
jgi:AcrR family transcriptional regulator